MGRKRKNSDELSRPRIVISPPKPVLSRPQRSTKDAFYNKLGDLTMTNKVIRPVTQPEIAKKKETVKKAPKRLAYPLPIDNRVDIGKTKKFTSIPVRQMPLPMNCDQLHAHLKELRWPRLKLAEINIFPMAIDPRLKYACDLCSLRCSEPAELTAHLSAHVEDFTQCFLCDKPEKPFSIQEFANHLCGHTYHQFNTWTCGFCGEIVSTKAVEGVTQEVVQHLFFQCQKIPVCMICGERVKKGIGRHRKTAHDKLMNRFICAACFCGFPSLTQFLLHICSMKYRCYCEISDTFESHEDINKHIERMDEIELHYHGILMPQIEVRRRCHFVNPHAILPPTHSEKPATNFGFRSMILPSGSKL